MPETPDNQTFLTIAELAARWRSSADTIKARIRRGEIKAMPCGKSHRIHRDEIARHESAAIAGAIACEPDPNKPADLSLLRGFQRSLSKQAKQQKGAKSYVG